jgi:hypothetical protein
LANAQPLPLLQQLTRGHPPQGDYVHPLSAVAAAGEDLLFKRGIEICHETVRFWWNRFGPMFAAEIRKRRVHDRSYSSWRWHLDEVFVKINGGHIISGAPWITKAGHVAGGGVGAVGRWPAAATATSLA